MSSQLLKGAYEWDNAMPERKRLSLAECVYVTVATVSSVRAADTETPPPGPPASGLALGYLTTACHIETWNQPLLILFFLLDFLWFCADL